MKSQFVIGCNDCCQTLNPKDLYIDNLLVTGCTQVCHSDNLRMTTSGATSNEKVVNMTMTFWFQWRDNSRSSQWCFFPQNIWPDNSVSVKYFYTGGECNIETEISSHKRYFVIGCTENCQNDSQWRKFRQYDIPFQLTGLILGLRPANERRRYKVTPSLIGWAQT